MKKILVLLLSVCVAGMAMGQEVVNGVLQGSPKSFMFLTPQTGDTSTSWNDSWVKPSFESGSGGSSFNYTQIMGVRQGTYPSHQFIVTMDSTVAQNNDNCFRSCATGMSYNRPVMAEAWDSDLHPGTYVDTVIQMGKPGVTSSNPSGIYAQQMLYSFVPDTNNPVLFLNFAFITEDAQHSNYDANPGVEFAVLHHGTNNYLSLGNYDPTHPYSCFWYRTPGFSGMVDPQNTPVSRPVEICPSQPSCPCQSAVNNIFTYPYTIIAFDLSEQARNHEAVDFRLRVHSCVYRYHWAYCYFTAKMVPAKFKVEYCEGSDTLKLDIPWGFREEIDNNGVVHTYNWYNGADSASATGFDPSDPDNLLTLEGSTIYHPRLTPNPAKPYFRCEVQSYTGIPFIYEATVNYYDMRPSFTVEPTMVTEGDSSYMGVTVHNTSQIGRIVPDGNGGLDTVWQNMELDPQRFVWNFGDGTPEVHGFEPSHIYADTGSYTISLYIEDVEQVCKSATIDTTVAILPAPSAIAGLSSEASVCIYPNPTTGKVTLDLSGVNAKTVELFSVNGELLYSVVPTDRSLTLSLSEYAAGIYFVRIHSDKAVTMRTIVKR